MPESRRAAWRRDSGRIIDWPDIEADPWSGLTLVAGLLFLSLVVTRAVLVPLTYDEAASYLRYIATDPLSVFNFATATNHLLNTLLTRVAHAVAGDSELVLRLPNVLAYVAYLWFSLLIMRRLASPAIGFAGFLLLNLNPYVLDFFALSRGYGLSLALVLGTVYFLLKSLPLLTAGGEPGADLSRALMLAGAATLANFTLANVFVAVLVLLLCAFVLVNRLTGSIRAPESQTPDPLSQASARWRWVFAGVFTVLVLSQDAGLSGALYEPVVVRLPGLSQADLAGVTVSRVDVRGRRRPLARRDHEWRLDDPLQVAGLRVELPGDVARRVSVLDVVIGSRSFRHRRLEDAWQIRDIQGLRVLENGPSLSLARSRVPAFDRIINWRGDAVYLATLARFTAIALALLAALTLLLKGSGWLLIRARLLTVAQWQVLASATVWLIALSGAPLYLLKRESELYLGGTRGLIPDTYFSVIDGSFYGVAYHSAQTRLAFAAILVSVAAAAAVMYLSWRRCRTALVWPALGVLGILVVVSISEILQGLIFGTPYLLSRMALFFIPLYLLFLVFIAEAAAALGRGARAVVAGALLLALGASVYHFAGTFNLTRAWEWAEDACTKGMIEDIGWVRGAEHGGRAEAVLAVDWIYYPVAVFYGRKSRPGLIHVDVGKIEEADFVYVQERNRPPALNMIKKYPACRTVLLRGERRGEPVTETVRPGARR